MAHPSLTTRHCSMLKLYFAPHTCALASHIALIDAGADHEAIFVSFKKRRAAQTGLSRDQSEGARAVARHRSRRAHRDTGHPRLYRPDAIRRRSLRRLIRLRSPQAQAFNSYLCSTLHVAHAHRMRGYSLGGRRVVVRRHAAQGAADGRRLLFADRADHVQGSVGAGRHLFDLRSLSLHASRSGWKPTASIRRNFRTSPIIAGA